MNITTLSCGLWKDHEFRRGVKTGIVYFASAEIIATLLALVGVGSWDLVFFITFIMPLIVIALISVAAIYVLIVEPIFGWINDWIENRATLTDGRGQSDERHRKAKTGHARAAGGG